MNWIPKICVHPYVVVTVENVWVDEGYHTALYWITVEEQLPSASKKVNYRNKSLQKQSVESIKDARKDDLNINIMLRKLQTLRGEYREDKALVKKSSKSWVPQVDVYVPQLWCCDKLHVLDDLGELRASTWNLDPVKVRTFNISMNNISYHFLFYICRTISLFGVSEAITAQVLLPSKLKCIRCTVPPHRSSLCRLLLSATGTGPSSGPAFRREMFGFCGNWFTWLFQWTFEEASQSFNWRKCESNSRNKPEEKVQPRRWSRWCSPRARHRPTSFGKRATIRCSHQSVP